MSRPPVPLPSIRDIFPEISIQGTPLPSPTQPVSLSPPRHPPPFLLHHPPPSPPPSSSSSESATRPPHMSPTAKPPACSFNVLRADPLTSSLEHVATSTTLRPRAASTTTPAHPGMHGAAPVFRVAIAPTEPRPPRHRPRTVREILPDTRERHHSRDGLSPSITREADLAHLRSPSSAILSFPISDHPVSTSSALITTDGRRLHLRSDLPVPTLQGEGRGKKHQCPHCGKRFNRPSSMKIHVNTHTGAKPYRCPFPGCGREFNVNSNMRRHWRNHSRSAPVRLPDPDVGPSGAYHHHPRLDGIPHHALMSPPATNSSASEDEDAYSEEETEPYPMDVDVDVDHAHLPTRIDPQGDEGVRHCAPLPPPSTSHPNAPSSASSDDSPWSRSASPARGPTSVPEQPLHRTVNVSANGHPHQDQQGRQPSQPNSQSHSHAHGHGHRSECIYRPSIPAYAISCTDSVSTALRPAFTSSSSCTTVRDRDRDRERDRYYPRHVGGSGRERERERRHGQGYVKRG